MRILAPMLIMLIAGLSLGAAGATLYWSGVADRGFKAQKEWQHAFSEMERASNSFEKTANECLAMVRSR